MTISLSSLVRGWTDVAAASNESMHTSIFNAIFDTRLACEDGWRVPHGERYSVDDDAKSWEIMQ